MKKTFFIFITVFMTQIISTQGQIRTNGINDNNQHTFNNAYINGTYNEATGSLEMICKKDLEQLNILIYKNGKLCEKENNINVKENDKIYYQLSDYGTGIFTICTENKKVVQVAGTVVCNE